MTRFIFLLLTTVVVVTAQEGTPLDHNPTREEMAGERDLKIYDDGGDIYESRMNAEQLSSLRAFIWDHWKQKKRGYVRFTDSYIDSANQAFIFVEPKQSNVSHIVLRSVNYWAGGDVVRRTLTDLPEIITLEQAKPQTDDYGGKYILLFRDKEGKIVKRL